MVTAFASGAYNAADTPLPRDLPKIAKHIEAGLAAVRTYGTHSPGNVTISQARSAIAACDGIVADTQRLAILLRGWIRLGRLGARQVARAERLLALIRETDTAAAKVTAAIRVRGPVPTDWARLVFDIPLHEIPLVSASLEFQIDSAGSDINLLAQAERASPHMLPTGHFRDMAADYRRGLEVVAAIDDQIRRWDLQALTPAQQVMIATLSDQTALLSSVHTDVFRRCALLIARINAAQASTLGTAFIADLIQDYWGFREPGAPTPFALTIIRWRRIYSLLVYEKGAAVSPVRPLCFS